MRKPSKRMPVAPAPEVEVRHLTTWYYPRCFLEVYGTSHDDVSKVVFHDESRGDERTCEFSSIDEAISRGVETNLLDDVIELLTKRIDTAIIEMESGDRGELSRKLWKCVEVLEGDLPG